ncbi:Glycerol-3-phosphate dehydrogenase [endosymbiont of Ridgeia piscesae]|uniref:Glycerol-3-phosphate dehydrogenase n=3 Tax=endosymbiont of Ridgeia piscesae TaxID=54398 RepID=A0A0T5YYI7_9GAMM|nr:Glycerol-3-phosphate dehydrogenase [endosymbiont of Ridgeia piscesae]
MKIKVKTVETDIVIFGGGIAGLWTLSRLRQAGYACLLLESGYLGGVQTMASQGIIHGGTKYALAGKLTGSSQAIREMPQIWRDCLAGRGEIDLSRVRLLASHQHLWSNGMLSRMAGFFAGKVMQSRISEVQGEDRPALFRDPAFHGSVYQLDEPVLDIASLIMELQRQHGDCCLQLAGPEVVEFCSENHLRLQGEDGRQLEIRSRRILLSAGAGNQTLLRRLGRDTPAMQRRPLQMVMLRGALPQLYAHCLGASANPRLTITSYPVADGVRIWYLGGDIAENGVGRDADAQIAAAQQELQELLPWVDLRGVQWATLNVDRAEPRQPDGKRPDNPYLEERDGVLVGWPTKLAFAPLLARRVEAQLRSAGIEPNLPEVVPDWPAPQRAALPWEHAQWS